MDQRLLLRRALSPIEHAFLIILTSPRPVAQRTPASRRLLGGLSRRGARRYPRRTAGNRPLATVRGATWNDGAARAGAHLSKAGYAIKGGVLVERTSGRPFAFEILVQSSTTGTAFADLCGQPQSSIGIYANVRLVDEVQYERRRQKFDFGIADLPPGSPFHRRAISSASAWGSQNIDQRVLQPRRRALTRHRRND